MNNVPRILLVEDDPDTRRSLTKLLTHAGYRTADAASGVEALKRMKTYWPDLILLDIRMPGMNGLELAARIKRIGDIPIIFLTALDDRTTRLRGLRHYAEDYITKPFDFEELEIRIQRILRRIGTGLPQAIITVDKHLTLDFHRGRGRARRLSFALTGIEARILYHLVRHAGKTVPADILLKTAWPRHAGTEKNLHHAIWNLRGKLEADPQDPEYILTDYGVGYRFANPGNGRPKLTNRQRQILRLIAQGATNNEIAAELKISTTTISYHSTEIRKALGATSRSHAVALGIKHGILSETDLFIAQTKAEQ
jgi:DNA-binding response OmpR family regulator